MEFIFRQDNAANSQDQGFYNNLLEWPTKSPDLNSIENVWGYLTKVVYQNGKQYQSAQNIRAAILCAWQGMPQNIIDWVMPNRCFKATFCEEH